MNFELLKQLCEMNAASSEEYKISGLIEGIAKNYCDEIISDNMGNLICRKKGNGKKVMLDAHMDEVALMITHITDSGYLKFETVGGIDSRVLVSKAITVGEKENCGIIGVAPAHKSKDTDGVLKIKDLYIDIGAKNKEEAEKLVNVGEYAYFKTKAEEIGENSIKAKAIDDRLGCFLLLELMKNNYDYDMYFCFSVQEEVGCRGAGCAAYRIEPDFAIAIEATTCSDVLGTGEFDFATHFKEGAVISLMDNGSVANKKLNEKLIEAAKIAGAKWQYKQTTKGANDAATIHVSKKGIQTTAVSAPARYIHSPATIVCKDDILSMYEIVNSALSNKLL